ncbi:hypothetical protein Tco_0363812, partial [Tanacetum coccineum]
DPTRGLSVVTSELPLIDLHKLGRHNICLRVGDTWAWVAPGLERQPDVADGAPRAAEDAPAADEGAQADPPPELRQSIVGLRGDVARLITNQSRFATWMDAIWRILGFGIRRIDLLYRPCCKEIDDMVYSEKDVSTSILMPRQHTFA